jgi:P-type Ca2+ transporter type 2C
MSAVTITSRDVSTKTERNAERQHWHAMEPSAVSRLLSADPQTGLTSSEVAKRQLQFGRNSIQSVNSPPAWRVLLAQFTNIVVALLAMAAVISWVTEDHAEAIAILVVLLLNAAVGFITEWQAGRALDALRRQSRTVTRVRRDGVELTVDAEELVPGDVVILNAGDRVPADARLAKASQLKTEESSLTGESTTVEKIINPTSVETLLADRHSMIYLGTAVAAGRAEAIVVSTGVHTQLGRIGRLAANSIKERSPLEIQLSHLGHRLVYLVLLIAGIVMLTGWLRGDGLWLMLEVGISLAVAAVPEGLPAVTTLILALGVLRMARQRAIMRRLPAVETLGSTTVICADKTGTLTKNRMTVREYYLSDGRDIAVEGSTDRVNTDPLLQQAVRIGVLCNEASFHAAGTDESRSIGDPTETALLVVADTLVLDVSKERATHPKIAELPFHSSTKRMTTLHRTNDGQHFAALKGAPSIVLKVCSSYVDDAGQTRLLDQDAVERFTAANERMASRALRVLALAIKQFTSESQTHTTEALEDGYTFIGLVGMIDPPRPGVAEAIQQAREAGIRTVMLTGDQLPTAVAIARELGLGKTPPSALHARDLIGAEPGQLAELAHKTDVFARVSPEEKLRIVEALQLAGEVVAVTGDGVNDAPALKRANIGIAMGQRGTDVAKEAADVVLADDNFTTIVQAVEGGRTIYANIIKFVHMMFSHNLGEVLMIFSAIAAGWPLPLLPLQILWMNLVTDVFPAMALALEPASSDIMNRPPRSHRESIFSKSFLLLISWQSVLLAAIALAAYAWALRSYGPGPHSRTVALFSLVAIQLGHTFNCRSRSRSTFEGIFRNPFIWAAVAAVVLLQIAAAYFAPLASVLDTVPPTPIDLVIIVTSGLLPIVVVETAKLFYRMSRLPKKGAK